jgi:hypothetical protein
VRHLIQAEHITSAEGKAPSGRKASSIHQHQLARIATLTRNNVTLKDAARIVVLPKHRVRALVDGGIITPLITPKQTNAATWLIQMQQVKKLWFKPQLKEGNVTQVPIKIILKHWQLQKAEFVALVLAISNNDIVPVSENNQPAPIGKLRLDDLQVQAWLNAHRIKSIGTMSVDHASKLLGLKQQVTYELARSGLLNTTLDNQKGLRVSEDSIQLFQETYVSLVELANSTKSSPRKVLKEISCLPVCGPSVDGSRQYFFRRSDIADINTSSSQERSVNFVQ